MTEHLILHGRKVAFLAADGVQQEEFEQPWQAVLRAGGIPELISDKDGEVQATLNGKEGRKFKVDHLIGEVNSHGYAGLVIPGGLKSPDTLRMEPTAVAFVKAFLDQQKPVAAICHAPWMLVEAGLLKGRKLTSYPSLRTDIVNAGGTWDDKAVIIDENLVTSRTPKDLPQFCEAMIHVFANSIEERALDKAVEQSFPASDPLPGP